MFFLVSFDFWHLVVGDPLPVLQVLDLVYPDQPVLGRVCLLHVRQLKVLVADFYASCPIIPSRASEVQL